MANLKDIAEKTGLSINTVSRALRGRGYVSSAALEKVQHAAAELGYAPNRAARSLRFRRNFEIAVLVFISKGLARGDALTMDKLIGIKERIASSGYEINLQFIYSEDRYGAKSRGQLAPVLRQKPAGIIVIGDAPQQLGMAAECAGSDIPAVIISYSALEKFNCVYIDRAQGICDAVDYLYSLGRRTIVYAQLSECANRLRGYRRSIRKNKLAEHIVSVGGIPPGHDELFETGVKLAGKILEQVPGVDAVQAYSDYVAAGIIAGLTRAGRQIPRDIAVTGFDNRDLAAFTTPPLTTPAQPNIEAGKLAVELLLERIDAPASVPKAVKVPMNLIIRKST